MSKNDSSDSKRRGSRSSNEHNSELHLGSDHSMMPLDCSRIKRQPTSHVSRLSDLEQSQFHTICLLRSRRLIRPVTWLMLMASIWAHSSRDLSTLLFLFVYFVNLISQHDSFDLLAAVFSSFLSSISDARWINPLSSCLSTRKIKYTMNNGDVCRQKQLFTEKSIIDARVHLETWIRVGQVKIRPELEIT